MLWYRSILASESPLCKVPVLNERDQLMGAVTGMADLIPFMASLAVVVNILYVKYCLQDILKRTIIISTRNKVTDLYLSHQTSLTELMMSVVPIQILGKFIILLQNGRILTIASPLFKRWFRFCYFLLECIKTENWIFNLQYNNEYWHMVETIKINFNSLSVDLSWGKCKRNRI